MKQYIYNYVNGITDSYHDGGGLVIITEGKPQEALNKYFTEYPIDEVYVGTGPDGESMYEPKPAPTLEEPDHTYELAGTPEETVLIFPDNGCC